MPKLAFTRNIQRHVACRDTEASGDTVREVLDTFFAGTHRGSSAMPCVGRFDDITG